MKKINLIAWLFSWSLTFSQNVGINVSQPTETLDINGGLRMRNIPSVSGKPPYLVSINDTGKVTRITFDSLQSQMNANASEMNILTFVAGDTISRGDCVALGNGTTGILGANTYADPATPHSVTSTAWLAQTFKTGTKTIAIKSITIFFEGIATTPAMTLTCSIRNVSGGVPVGTDVGGRVATASSFYGSGFQTSNVRMVFDPPLPVSPNTFYAWVFRTAFSGSFASLYKQNLGSYSQGTMCISVNSGATWTVQSSYDLNGYVYECQTVAGRLYRSDPSFAGGNNIVGWNVTASCVESEGCPSGFYGKKDQFDNLLGIALENVLPGQNVPVQVLGATDAVTGFSIGRKLYVGLPPGSLSLSGSYTKSVGISTGSGMIIQVVY